MIQRLVAYRAGEVDESILDHVRNEAQKAARKSAIDLGPLWFKEAGWDPEKGIYAVKSFRNGSLLPPHWVTSASALGPKHIITDTMNFHLGRTCYDALAHDSVALAINNFITTGAVPLLATMQLTVGSYSWFTKEVAGQPYWRDLIIGWKRACKNASCAWNCSRPRVDDDRIPRHIVRPIRENGLSAHTVQLSCSIMGIIRQESHTINDANVRAGDAIVMLPSSGNHADAIAYIDSQIRCLRDGYHTLVSSSLAQKLGEALLRPAHIYAPVIETCQDAGIPLHAAINMVDRGWKSLLSSTSQPFACVIERLGRHQLPEFTLLQQAFVGSQGASLSHEEVFSIFNMGAGFALIVPPQFAETVLQIAALHGLYGWKAGYVEESLRPRVYIKPNGVILKSQSMRR